MLNLLKKYLGGLELLLISLMLIILPFVYSNKTMDPTLYPRFYYLSCFLLALTVFVAYKLFTGKFEFKFPRLVSWVFGFALLYLINHIISSVGVINGKEAIFQTLKEGAYVLYFIYLYIIMTNEPIGRDILIKSVILTALGFSLIAVWQIKDADFTKFLTATDNYAYYLSQALWNVKSTLANKNPFASLLFLSLPFIIYGVVGFKKVWRVISIITLGLNFTFIALMVSKTAWGALALFIVILAIQFMVYLFVIRPKLTGKKLSLIQKVSILVVPVLIVVISITVLFKSDIKFFKVITDKVQQITNPDEHLKMYSKDNPSSMETRVIVWSKTVQMIKDYSVLGVGPGHWRIYQPAYGLDQFDNKLRQGATHFQRPHNDFLWIAAELGIFGLLFYLAIYGLILLMAIRNFTKTTDNKERILNGAIFASLVGYLVILFLSFSRERIPHNLVYLAMFSLVLVDYKNRKEDTDSKVIKPMGRNVFIIFIIAFSIVNINIAHQILSGAKNFRQILYYTQVKKNANGILRACKKIEGTFFTLDPFSTPIYYHKGSAQVELKDIKGGNESFKKAVKLHPNHIAVLNNLATTFDLLGQPDTAMVYYKRALEISPRYVDANVNLATVYYNKQKFTEALICLKNVPFSTNSSSKRLQDAIFAVCYRYVLSDYKDYDTEKLMNWARDRNKVFATFVNFQSRNESFKNVLLQELKN